MAIVSISEAARLTGKTRATIHRHINTGKLSKTKNDTGNTGVDTSELVRVYDIKINTPNTCSDTVKIEHHNTVVDTDELNTLKTRLAILEAENHHLKDHVDSLKQAMLLLDHKEETKKANRSWLARLYNNSN